ncbi:exonuclease domain-containing protein [Streptomyces sp. NPDC088810]|uniref:3'-5' exonuclease n=1 Tax=Streptomyces sp. NPDC088810 TaxID=3365904 RepID=UPI003815FA23
MDPDDVTQWDHWLDHLVDGAPVQLVRPSDTDRPTWAAYEETRYLGTVHGQFDFDGRWHVQSLNERHLNLDDAVRALRRPATWAADRERVRRWARNTLSDPRLLVLDIQTTGLDTAWAVQIGVTDRDGNALFDELVNPLADITPEATALHGLAPNQLASAPTFDTLLPDLAHLLANRCCLAYNADFDRAVLEREIHRLPQLARTNWATLHPRTWTDAMAPYAAWKGLWSARHCSYRYQPLGGIYEAVTNCRRLLSTMRHMC